MGCSLCGAVKLSGNILSTENLSKRFGAIIAVDDVNLSIKQGEVHAIIGPNGAGKTTLLSVLSGELPADNGRLLFNGKDITGKSFHKRAQLGLARSFQITSVIMPMTLLQNVALAVQSKLGHSFKFWKPVDEDQQIMEAAANALETVGLESRMDVFAGQVSHGEQRQLEIAMALALEPSCLLLDEPMAGMGAEESAKMVSLLQSLKGQKTLVLIEHDMDAVFSLADRISVLVGGQIIASDTPQNIRQNIDVQRAYLGSAEEHAAS